MRISLKLAKQSWLISRISAHDVKKLGGSSKKRPAKERQIIHFENILHQEPSDAKNKKNGFN